MVCYLEAFKNGRFQRTVFDTILISALITQIQVGAWTYHYSDQKIYPWNGARRFCQKLYTDLVAIQNKDEIAYLNEFLPYHPQYYWIGIRKINNIWTWVGTNKTLTKEAENWAENEPNNKRNDQDCVEIYIKRNSSAGKWNDEPCMKRKRALCYKASCEPFSCNNQGECIETIGNYTCSCYPGFYGPECEYVVECKELDLFPGNMRMTCSHPLGDFSYKSTCNFYCMEGHRLNGASTLECLASGEWTAEIPQCSVTGCPALKSPERGNMNCSYSSKKNVHGSSCSFSCEEGFILKGEEVVWCTAGAWTAPVPQCEAVRCPDLQVPNGGSMNCAHSHAVFAYGSTCKFSCQPGHRVNGFETLQCLASGQWTSPMPTCHAIACDPLENPVHGSSNCSSLTEFQYNSRCSFQCAKGFILKGAQTTECSLSGTWTAPAPVCHAKQCQHLSAPNKGHMSCSHPFGNFMYRSSCSFTCEEGFVPNGPQVLHCLDTGNWSPPPPLCEAIKCPPLIAPPQGMLQCSEARENLRYNSTCDFSCKRGLMLIGAERLKCTASGSWTTPPPYCKAIECPVLDDPKWGSRECSYKQGDYRGSSICHFTCDKGFVLKGSNNVQCLPSGKWTAPPPTCEVVKCPELTLPKSMRMNCSHPLGNFSYESTCIFSCPKGQVLNSSSEITCEAEGNWSKEMPTCQEKLLSVQEALTYFGGAVASVTSLIVGGSILALLRRRFKQQDDGKRPLSPQSVMGTPGVFTNMAFDSTS
ncbi:P-selectin [Antechinus flavipes]|uniref:P-selectin n=1 Tax=Antechinus flavipes TaxID=38775 RepID=UPI0022363357|nr:P-selectin [Antechinus flavipes]